MKRTTWNKFSIFGALLLSLATLPATGFTQTAPVLATTTPAQFPQHDVGSAFHLQARPFVDAGFTPIEDVVESGRDVRRAMIRDPYWILAMPGIEIERYRNNTAVLRLQYLGWRSKTRPIPIETWDALAKLEANAFAPPPPVEKAKTDANTAPPPICHGWSASLLTSDGHSAAWGECYGENTAATRNYIDTLILAALATEPSCPVDQTNPLWSFQKCFGVTQTLDDPNLSTQYTALINVFYKDTDGSNILLAARAAMRAPGIAVGNDVWLKARDAVARLKAHEDVQLDALHALGRLKAMARNASDADRAKLQSQYEYLNSTMHGYEANYSGLLEQLTWAGEKQTNAK